MENRKRMEEKGDGESPLKKPRTDDAKANNTKVYSRSAHRVCKHM